MQKKIKVGILGLGRAGYGMHIEELGRFPDEFEIVAACDEDAEQRECAAKVIANAKIYASFDEMLADPEVELVTIATRSFDHPKHAVAAAAAGKYVMVEKPIAGCLKDAMLIDEAAKKYPGHIFIRHNRRFEPAFTHIREIIASGRIGNVYEIKLCRHGYSWRCDWQTILSCGGGQLLNWGPHLIDHGLRLLESPVADIWCDLKVVAAKGDAEDHVKIILKGENGRIIDIEISGGVALRGPVYAVFGNRGSLISDDEKRIRLKYLNPAIPLPEIKANAGIPKGNFTKPVPDDMWVTDDLTVAPSNGDNVHKIWHYLYEAIRLGKPYPIKLEEALEVVRVCDEIKRRCKIQDVR